MEINIENAFAVSVRLSLGLFSTPLKKVSQNVHTIIYQMISSLLKKPLLSTLLISFLLMMLLSALTLSVLTVVAVTCVVIVIFLFEGFIFGVILILAAAITVLFLGLLIIYQGFRQSCDRAPPNNEHLNRAN